MANWIALGLGNPGESYIGTRHNLGHWFVDALADSCGESFISTRDFLVSKSYLGKSQLILAKSSFYMNQNGKGINNLLESFKCCPSRLLVVHDELTLPFARTKLSAGKNSAGHKGVESVLAQFTTFSPLRLRLGMGVANQLDCKLSEFVLSVFSASELSVFKSLLPNLIYGIRLLLEHGSDRAMNYLNRHPLSQPPLL